MSMIVTWNFIHLEAIDMDMRVQGGSMSSTVCYRAFAVLVHRMIRGSTTTAVKVIEICWEISTAVICLESDERAILI
ncbi:hypothetical protein D3C85_1817110 [compost metagenome]